MNIREHLHDQVVPNARNGYQPLALRHRPLALYAVVLIGIKVLTFLYIPQTQAATTVNVQSIIDLTNQSRASYNLKPLQENIELDHAAQAKADDMLAGQYFAHTSPDGKTPWDFIKEAGYGYMAAGENLAINFYTSEGVEQAWMNSPGHKANILNRNFQDIGIGISEGKYRGADAIFVVQMFGSPSEQIITPQSGYTVPAHYVSTATIDLPKAKYSRVLKQPVISAPQFNLLNKNDFVISGTASGSSQVYVLANNQAIAVLPVINNLFSGQVMLPEGQSTLKVVGYAGRFASSLSNPIQVQVDTTAPQIVNTQMGLDNTVQVEVSGAPVKVFASLANQNILLQPTANPEVWQGKFDLSANELQGNLNIMADDMAGNISMAEGATFENSEISNYAFGTQNNPLPTTGPIVYLYFFLGLLALIGINIGIKKEIQHWDVLLHASALASFALLLWVT